MKVEPDSEEILAPSQKWTPDGGRSSFDDEVGVGLGEGEGEVLSGHGLGQPRAAVPRGADGETGRVGRGGRR